MLMGIIMLLLFLKINSNFIVYLKEKVIPPKPLLCKMLPSQDFGGAFLHSPLSIFAFFLCWFTVYNK